MLTLFHLRRLLTVVVISLLLVLAAAVPDAGAATSNQGLQAGWVVDDNGGLDFPHAYQRQLPLIQEAGAGWIRVNFRLGNTGCYPDWTTVGCTGKTALQQYDTFINDARAQGLKVLGLLSNESWNGGQDQWIVNNAEHTGGNGDNAYMRAFSTNAAVVLTTHFKGRITIWQVWNEPNAWTSNPAPGVYEGVTFIYPSNFAWLLRHVYEDTRAADPNLGVTFVSGAVVSGDADGMARKVAGVDVRVFTEYKPRKEAPKEKASSPAATACSPSAQPIAANYLACTYLQGQVYAAWDAFKTQYGTYPLDQIGQHLYVDQWSRTSSTKLKARINDVRSVYVGIEGAATPKKTVITEIGWATNHVSQKTQSDNLQLTYSTFKTVPYILNTYWFSSQDIPESGLYYGLQTGGSPPNYTGSHKQSFRTYQRSAAY